MRHLGGCVNYKSKKEELYDDEIGDEEELDGEHLSMEAQLNYLLK